MAVAPLKQVWVERGRSWLTRLGWGHRGFRHPNYPKAVFVLGLILLGPFLFDQYAFQQRLAHFGPDLKGYLREATQFWENPAGTLYGPQPWYLYPPFFLTFMRPLTQLSTPWAAAVFETLKWVALWLNLWMAWRICSPRGEDLPPIVGLASIAMTWRFFTNDMGQGNVNIFLLCAMLAGGWFLLRGRPFFAGLAVSFAVCVKVTPALLLVYLAWRGGWRVLAGALCGAAFWLLAWPSLWFGWANNWQALCDWFRYIIAAFLKQETINGFFGNQSLSGVLGRLLGPDEGVRPNTSIAWIVLARETRGLVLAGLAACILGTWAWVCRKPGRVVLRQPLAFGAEMGLTLIAMLLLSGLSWKAHFVSMLLPYTVLLAYLADARYTERRRAVGILTAISFVFGTLTSDIITPTGADYAEAYGFVAWGAVAAAAGLLVVRAELRRAALTVSDTLPVERACQSPSS